LSGADRQHGKDESAYITAVNRDRDSYQVPLALAEAGWLQALVTDVYASDGLARLMPSLAHRRIAGLPAALTRSNLAAVLAQMVGIKLLHRQEVTLDLVHSLLGRNARAEARRSRADLLLYAQCAYEAFTDPQLEGRRRVLFAFHPHRRLIAQVLRDDMAAFPEIAWTMREIETTTAYARREDAELQRAELILCASRFTQRSLQLAGVEEERIRVVPYGAPQTAAQLAKMRGGVCRFLFVGQGVQRKGLHHLLTVWRRLALPKASLTVVCYRLDPALQPLLGGDVTLIQGASRDDVSALFGASHVFVMPSLAEGFGLVFPEAMAAGCYVIATENTGVPDLTPPDALASVVRAGDLEQLTAAMERACVRHQTTGLPHGEIVEFAKGASWSQFRQRLRDALAV
jgi:glycosyltransferase involved in cell wall biosynthesis